MSTRRLYWETPYETAFDAEVTEAFLDKGLLCLVLDKTMFHPEGGGQPADSGVIEIFDEKAGPLQGNSFEVAAVSEQGDEVVHALRVRADLPEAQDRLDGRLAFLVGSRVRGTIDWAARFDFMQQHTGQHILSRAFEEALGANTVGFHLGKDRVTVDLDVPGVSEGAVLEVEQIANRVVFQNVPVVTREYPACNVPECIGSRFIVEAPRIRVVHVGEFDACPCGGTHVSSSGQVGLIKVNRLDRAHGGVRVVFRCGQRALADYDLIQDRLQAVCRELSVSPGELLQSVQNMRSRMLGLEKSAVALRKTLLNYEIAGIVRETQSWDSARPVVKCLPGKGPQELRAVATRVSDSTGLPVVFFGMSPKFQAVAACPAKPRSGVQGVYCLDAGVTAVKIGKILGGKGGGSPMLAQVGAKELVISEQEAVDRILACVKEVGQPPGTKL